jgi:ABC-type spermidine/putrescine transport system permease subunit I
VAVSLRRRRRRGHSDGLTAWLLLPAGLLLIVFLAVPLCATVWLSLSPNPLVHFSGAGLNNYAYLLSKRYYTDVTFATLRLTAETTGAALLFGYPAAMVLADLTPRIAGAISLAMTLPILAGPLVVVLGWMILLSEGGPVFGPLLRAGLIARPHLLGSETGIVIGVLHFVLPFVVLSLANVLRAIPAVLIEAARELGASPLQRFLSVTLPLSLPGALSATIIAVSLAVGSFVAPHYLGGPGDMTLTTLIAQFMLATYNGQLAAAVAVLLLVAMSVLILALSWAASRWGRS